MFISVTVLVLWLFVLIILSGDVQVNPGPNSVEGDADSSINSSSSTYRKMLCQRGSDFFLLALCVCVLGGGGSQVQYISFREKITDPHLLINDWSL